MSQTPNEDVCPICSKTDCHHISRMLPRSKDSELPEWDDSTGVHLIRRIQGKPPMIETVHGLDDSDISMSASARSRARSHLRASTVGLGIGSLARVQHQHASSKLRQQLQQRQQVDRRPSAIASISKSIFLRKSIDQVPPSPLSSAPPPPQQQQQQQHPQQSSKQLRKQAPAHDPFASFFRGQGKHNKVGVQAKPLKTSRSMTAAKERRTSMRRLSEGGGNDSNNNNNGGLDMAALKEVGR